MTRETDVNTSDNKHRYRVGIKHVKNENCCRSKAQQLLNYRLVIRRVLERHAIFLACR